MKRQQNTKNPIDKYFKPIPNTDTKKKQSKCKNSFKKPEISNNLAHNECSEILPVVAAIPVVVTPNLDDLDYLLNDDNEIDNICEFDDSRSLPLNDFFSTHVSDEHFCNEYNFWNPGNYQSANSINNEITTIYDSRDDISKKTYASVKQQKQFHEKKTTTIVRNEDTLNDSVEGIDNYIHCRIE